VGVEELNWGVKGEKSLDINAVHRANRAASSTVLER